MKQEANHAVPEQGKFWRALAALWAVLQAIDSTNFDYLLDRMERLEQEVGRLREELRKGGNFGAVDTHSNSGPAAEH